MLCNYYDENALPKRRYGAVSSVHHSLRVETRRICPMRIEQLVPAEPGWKAVFKEPDGSETLSRILGWAALGDDGDLVGVIVDPGEPSQIVPAVGAVSPDGGSFSRYRFMPPEPPPPPPPPPPAAPAPAEEPAPQEAAQQLAKSILKRRR
jgi:hypothetical protein